MRIALFGATGGTGKNLVERGLHAGHEIIAVARRPEAIPVRERLILRKADVFDAASVKEAIAGAEAVISVIGPAKNSKPGTVISEGTKNILAACESTGVRRFVFESGMIMSDGSELSFGGRFAITAFACIFPHLYNDKAKAEASITASSLDWVIVRPPVLTHGEATGSVIAAPRARIMPAKGITHAECADALLRAATEPAWVKQVVNVGRA